MQFLLGLGRLLNGAGYNVQYFTAFDCPKGQLESEVVNWSGGSLKKLYEFGPDRVIVFNGFAQETIAATMLLRDSMPGRVFHVEQGWLPQRGNIYISSGGTGYRSGISDWVSRQTIRKEMWDFSIGKMSGILQAQYRVDDPRPNIPENYILVPLQLEQDTSIIYDSSWLKTMKGLLQIAMKKFPNNTIIVKPHPYQKEDNLINNVVNGKFSNVILGDVLVKTNAYAKYAGLVLGINSTSLIESLIHKVPVACLGKNVLSGTGSYAAETLEGLNRVKPRGAVQDWAALEKLCILNSIQFSRATPPKWVINYIESGVYPSFEELEGTGL